MPAGWNTVNESFAHSIERSRGYFDCARSLFRDGFLLECHSYMIKALQTQLDAWGELSLDSLSATAEESATLKPWQRTLASAGYSRIDRLSAALLVGTQLPPAVLARPLSADFDWIWAEVERLTSFSAKRALSTRARKLRRWRRTASVAVVALLVALVAVRLWSRPRVQASGVYSRDYSAEHVLDGSGATEWLLPDGTVGWVELILPSARAIRRVQISNAHSTLYLDRGARAVRVTAFAGLNSVASAEGAFERISEQRSVLDLPLKAERVTRVRVEILSYFEKGGGLADVELE